MAICRVCSSEIIGPDRYCRNCGAPVAPTVVEFDDTRRFNPSTPLPAAAPGTSDPTNPRYASPYVQYSTPQPSSSLKQTATLIKALLKQKLVWALLALMLFTFVGMGIGIGRSAIRRRPPNFAAQGQTQGEERAADADPQAIRQKYEEAVQNALGFRQGAYSAAEFPDTPGIFVNNLMSDDSPAAVAKIQAGDLLTELNGKLVRNDNELSEVLDSLKTGEEIPVTLYRDGAKINSRIKVADRAFPPLQTKMELNEQGFLGILDSSRRCCIPGTKKWGVEVKELYDNGPAELFGLRSGDVITEFNGHPVKTPNEFNRHIRAAKPGGKISVTFYRGSAAQKIELILGHRWEEIEGIMGRRR